MFIYSRFLWGIVYMACARCLRAHQTIYLFICVRMPVSVNEAPANRVTVYSTFNIFVWILWRYWLNPASHFLSSSVRMLEFGAAFAFKSLEFCLCTRSRWYHQSKRHKLHRFGACSWVRRKLIMIQFHRHFIEFVLWMAEWQMKYRRWYFCGFSK